MNLRKRTWEIFDTARPGDSASRCFDVALVSLIFLNVIAVVVGSVESVQNRFGRILDLFEIVSVLIFSVEYVARLWSCTSDARFRPALRGRLRLALQAMSIIDFLAILPFYLPFTGVDFRMLRVLRLLRIVRVAKVGRYYASLSIMKDVLQSRKEELVLASVLLCLLLVVSSSLLYYCENTAQPDVFSSIPATMWWAVATLTTVGYGDMYPITVAGKIMAGVVAVIGIGMFALPAGILGSGFVESMQKKKQPTEVCPHCGKDIHRR